MEKVYGYARVSTTHQNTDRQISVLREFGIDERSIVVDKASGRDFNREGYIALKNTLLRSGDTLVIKELDRLGRNKEMIKDELRWFKENNIRIKVLDIPTTLVDCPEQPWIIEMVTNILIEVLSSIAEEERIKTHIRQLEGIKQAHLRGVKFGRPAISKPKNFDEIVNLFLIRFVSRFKITAYRF